MYTPLPTPAEMAQWDRMAIAHGVPEMLLMENASREALHVLTAEVGPLVGKRVLLFMGGGNNGGDAAALARHLHDAGATVLVLHTRPLARMRGVAAKHVKLAKACGVTFLSASVWPRYVPDTQWLYPDVVVDGLLGTGFSGSLRTQEATLVEAINGLRKVAFILALDIPSGLDGVTGEPCPVAVTANATVTFEAAKPGLVMPQAHAHAGTLHVRPIGIPAVVRAAAPPSCYAIGREAARLLPATLPAAHKGSAGHVLVIGGSHGLTGAPLLAALGALRAGAGLITLCGPGGLCAEMKHGYPEIMTLPLGTGTEWDSALWADLAPQLGRFNALVVGPGMGRTEGAARFVATLLAHPGRPAAVVDADALHALTTGLVSLDLINETDMLTPHPGEAARLLGITPGQVQRNRVASLAALAQRHAGITVLKGAGTCVKHGDGPMHIAPYAVPTLGVAGSGDVLAGICASLLAAGLATVDAANLGVLLHAAAGESLIREFPLRGNSPRDIADAIPQARKELSHAASQGHHDHRPGHRLA